MAICEKIKYRTLKVATKALHQQQKWGARVRRVYQCEVCGRFHLTSDSESTDQNTREKRLMKDRKAKKGKRKARVRERVLNPDAFSLGDMQQTLSILDMSDIDVGLDVLTGGYRVRN